MKVSVFSSKSYDKEYLQPASQEFGYELEFFEASLKPSTVKLANDSDVVCVFVNDLLNRQVLEKLAESDIKLVALRCAGFNNVDLKAADELGISVMRVPAYSPHAVAEHAVALILGLSRKTHKAFNRVRDANFSLERLVGFDLVDKTIGVIGTGKIGRVFASIMKGFGCKVIGYDPFPHPEFEELGGQYLNLNELLSQSDIVSLHCPLTPETHKIINHETIKFMKPGSMLINTSRGKLIDTDAILEALHNKHLGYLGIDVYSEEEKLFFRDLSEQIIDDEKIMTLTTFPNVLITAHQAFLTREALTQIANTTMTNIEMHYKGEESENRVTSKMLV